MDDRSWLKCGAKWSFEVLRLSRISEYLGGPSIDIVARPKPTLCQRGRTLMVVLVAGSNPG